MKPNTILLIAGAGAVGLAAFYVYRKGGISNAAQALGAGAVQAADGVITGAVGQAGAAVGLPTPSQTTTDPAVARWLIDQAGHFEASKWSSAPAYMKALFLPAGSGTPPPAGSDVARQFAALVAGYSTTDTGDETARLMRRYPGASSPESLFSGAQGGSFSELAGMGGQTFDYWGIPGPGGG